ncbi:biotin--[acetyl-CoA-carboxylase] ligase [Patiriisocius hiemis]|uniref:Biotin--[acetyl-CoA-carboxylase] ligase n=1 Tax=Patiriisocius hiemis TaxID=3075604 RepID=A0ABU2YDN6_9FLAO|nr:biotin--[acetyl-CoA-carboxylase] ligase [Constantimarinum sp. W242]MDT0555971.1 biotin--[acetyl-CoA-carboxylase] ligase [Constantimarinum sp. W242]
MSLKLIKLDAIDSTNNYLKELARNTTIVDETVVVAKRQLKGRGQMENSWQSQNGKSLTFSVLKKFTGFKIDDQAYLNYAVSVGVYNGFKKLEIKNVTIKWPNDILSYGKKVCGILIETQLAGNEIVSSIIGLGINVNETSFIELPKASSLRLVSGKDFILSEVLEVVCTSVLDALNLLNANAFQKIKTNYEENLFRKDQVSSFKDINGNLFNGIIKGVNSDGKLLIETEDEKIKAFGFKEVTLLY